MTVRIKNNATGELHNVADLNGYDASAWTQIGPALPAGLDWSIVTLVGGVWVEDATIVEATLLSRVKSESEKRKMAVLTAGAGKSSEYDQKRREALASANVIAATLNTLSAAAALEQYPAAWTEKRITGEQLSVVLTRYRTAAAASDSEVYRVSAIEQTGCMAIRSASTAIAKRAAFSAINWSWT